MPRAYSYVRMSRPEQLRGDSLRRQVEAARRFAEERGLDLDDSLQDIGVSAYRGKNRDEGALRRFLDLVESGDVPRGSYLIVESLDRLSREAVLEALPRFLDLVKAGVTIATLSDGQEYSADRLGTDWTPLIVSLAVMARAHEESRMKGQRVGAAWEAKRKNASEQPLTAKCPAWLRLADDRRAFEVIPERAEIVRRIFDDSASGVGARAIARALNRDGVAPWGRADGWQESYVKKVLGNPATLGEYQPHRKRGGKREPVGDVVRDYYPSVVDEVTFYRAAKARAERRVGGGGRRGRTFSNVLTHIAQCSTCGRSMRFVNKGSAPRGGTYLACSGALRGLCENRTHYPYPALEEAILRGVHELDLSSVASADTDNEAAACREQITALEGRIKDRQTKRKRVLAAFADGDEDVKEIVDDLGVEIDSAKAELREARRELKNIEHSSQDIRDHVDQIERLRKTITDAMGDDEAFRIRAAINQELQRVLKRVMFGTRDDGSHLAYVALHGDDSGRDYVLSGDRPLRRLFTTQPSPFGPQKT